MQRREDEEAGSWLQDLPLRGTNSTRSKSKQTTSNPYIHNLPLRGTNSTVLKRKFVSESQSEIAAPAAGVKRHNPQGVSAPPLTELNEKDRAAASTLMWVGEGVTSQQALRKLCLVDDNCNPIKAGIILERIHPSTSPEGGSREAEPTPTTTVSAPFKQPAVYALKLWQLIHADTPRGSIRTHYPLPSGCVELHSTLTATNAEARRVGGEIISSTMPNGEDAMILQHICDQKVDGG